MMSSGGVAERARRGRAPRDAAALRARPPGILGGQWAGALAGRAAPDHVRHGRHLGRHRHRHRGRDHRGLGARHLDRRLPAARADARRAHDRRRRRLDRLRRRGRRLPRRPAQRRAPTPGPACYGHGGAGADDQRRARRARAARPGALPRRPDDARPRRRRRRRRAARRAARARRSPETAEGILTIANSNMARAIRSRTIEKGHDPREFALVAFGGAGPLHAAEVADSLEIPEVLVPPYPGITSAGGPADERPQVRPDAHRLPAAGRGRRRAAQPRARRPRGRAARLARARRRRRRGHRGDPRARLPLRRPGLRAARDARRGRRSPRRRSSSSTGLHEREYGSAYGDPIEIVNARVTAIGKRPALDELPVDERQPRARRSSARARATSASTAQLQALPTRFYDRATLPLDEAFAGPAVVFHLDTTTVVPPGWTRAGRRAPGTCS